MDGEVKARVPLGVQVVPCRIPYLGGGDEVTSA
jgi:hypothetical protein